MILYRSKADGVDRLQAGDMVEAQDLDIQIGQTCNRRATIRGGGSAPFWTKLSEKISLFLELPAGQGDEDHILPAGSLDLPGGDQSSGVAQQNDL